ncbi:MAG: response regulator transcription factor [Bacteroidales bacterium]|nr:response regulator transcription factor [Bacteroidales bacterium]
MSKFKILIVDDEPDICEILSFYLDSEGYETITANSAEDAIDMLSPEFSIILLDVMMKGLSGYKMAEGLRKAGNNIPIIFLTAKDTENDMLTGFSVGGDDYISKPFSLKEVSARIKAVLKRQPDKSQSDTFKYKNLYVNFNNKEASINNEDIGLTKTEFEILELLIRHKDKIFSREEIIGTLWKETPYITDRTVDVHITRLRKKLGEYSGVIANRSGYGYRLFLDD